MTAPGDSSPVGPPSAGLRLCVAALSVVGDALCEARTLMLGASQMNVYETVRPGQ